MSRERVEALWQSYQEQIAEIEARASGLGEREYFQKTQAEYQIADVKEKMNVLVKEIGGSGEVSDISEVFGRSDLGAERYAQIADKMQEYIPLRHRVESVHPLEDAVRAKKEEIAASEMSEEQKQSLYALLDRANAVCEMDDQARAEHANHYAEAVGKDSMYGVRDEMKILTGKPEYRAFDEIFDDVEKLGGGTTYDIAYEKNPVTKESLKQARQARATLSEETKEKVRVIWDMLDEYGLGSAGGEESATPEKTVLLGLFQISREMEQAIVGGEWEKLQALTEQREKQARGLDALYSKGAELFGEDDSRGYGDNNSSFRSISLPPRYKTSVRVDTNINVISMMQDYLRRSGIEREAFLADPIGVAYEAAENYIQKVGLPSYERGKSLGEALAQLSQPQDPVPNGVSAGPFAVLDMLTHIETGERREQNILPLQFAMHDISRKYMQTMQVDMFPLAFEQSLGGIFLFNDEDRRLSDFVAMTTNFETMKINRGVDTLEYLQTHEIDPQKLHDRITGGILDYIQKGGDLSHLNAMVESARDSIEQVMAVKGIDLKSPAGKALVLFHDEPAKSIVSVAHAKGIQSLGRAGINPKARKTLAEQAKDIAKETKLMQKEWKALQKMEKAYNKRADKLTKAAEKAEKAFDKKPSDSKRRVVMKKRYDEVKRVREAHVKKLDDMLAQGKITQLYHEARVSDITLGDHNIERGMYDDRFCDKKTFMRVATVDGKMTKKQAVTEFKQAQSREAKEFRAVVGRRASKMEAKVYESAGAKNTRAEQIASEQRQARNERREIYRRKIELPQLKKKPATVSRSKERSEPQRTQEKKIEEKTKSE